MLIAESFSAAAAPPSSQPSSLRLRSKPKSMTTMTIPTTTTSTTTSKRAAAAAASANISRAMKADFDLSSFLGEPKEEEQEQQYSFNNDIPIVHTPRRGRRVGKVDLGWDSFIPFQQQSACSPSVSPRKRKVEDDGVKSSDANIRLVESQGRATAAIPKLANNSILAGLDEHSTPPHSSQQSFDPTPTAAPTYDRLAGFHKEEDAFSLPVLVPVEIPKMGRMAVHRSEASKIACMDTSILFKDSSSSGSSVGGTSTSTRPTSTLDDAFSSLDPSPSFSLSSHFPASEPTSPTKAFSKYDLQLFKASPETAIRERMQSMRNAQQKKIIIDGLLDTTTTSWKPRLDGPGMPQLNWPDSPNGPWSGAGEEIRRLQEQKRRGIARWLDEDSEEESTINGTANEQQHPMVAKAMHDRARKETLIRSLSMSHLKTSKHLSPVKKSSSSRRRRIKLEETSKKRGLDQKTVYLHPPPKAVGRLAGYTLSSPSSTVGCSCGSIDETSEMVQCDACNLWFHLMCIGVLQSNDLGEEWFCHGCCDMASIGLSPNSLSDRASLIATPNFPRSAAIAGQQLRLSQGQLPVFAQPSHDSPLVRCELRHHPQHALPSQTYTSALALAPSPTLPSSHKDVDRRSNSGKRHRASRIGSYQVEPGSPLERKSGPILHHRRTTSGHLANGQVSLVAPSPHRRRVPTFEHGKWINDFSSTAAPPRTPSPQFNHTPRSRSTNMSVRHYREHSNRDLDDVFSTPSRILQGSASWGAPQWQQSSNHSTSMMRHSREDSGLAASHSTPWGLSTPTRFLDSGDLHSEYSEGHGGLPSLVYSSGGLDLADLTWQLQSPSSSTRAATRARQNTSTRKVVGNTSSARDKTPTPQSSQGKSSCASSSPFPKTPTFPDLMTMHHHHHHHHLPHQSPQSTSNNKNLHRLSQQLTPTNAASAASTQHSSVYPSARTSSQPKARHVSSGEIMAGLGIGLDLEDVLEWA